MSGKFSLELVIELDSDDGVAALKTCQGDKIVEGGIRVTNADAMLELRLTEVIRYAKGRALIG
jgi:hypothetical protein